MATFDELIAEEQKKKKKPSQVAATQNSGKTFDDLIAEAKKPVKSASSVPTTTPSATPTPKAKPTAAPVQKEQPNFFQRAIQAVKKAVVGDRSAPTPSTLKAPTTFDTSSKSTVPFSTLVKTQNLFDSPQVQSASLKITSKSLADQKEALRKEDVFFGKIRNVIDTESSRLQIGINDLSKGVVAQANDVAPRKEYSSEQAYQNAIKESKKPSLLKSINSNLGAGSAGITGTLTFGAVAPDIPLQNEKAYKAGAILGMVGAPAKTLVKFIAIDFSLHTALKALTGKENVSELLPEDTNPGVLKAVDIATFLGEAFLAHKIKPGKLTDTFTKTTLEKYNVSSEMTITNKQFKDIHQTGRLTTAEEKDMIRKLKLTPEEYKTLLKSDKDVVIPASKITYIVDRPYWKKVKGIFKIDESKPIKPEGKVPYTTKDTTSGLLTDKIAESPTFTPEQLKTQIQATDLAESKLGAEMQRVITIAEKRNKSIKIVVNPVQGNLFKNLTPAGARLGYELAEPQKFELQSEEGASLPTETVVGDTNVTSKETPAEPQPTGAESTTPPAKREVITLDKSKYTGMESGMVVVRPNGTASLDLRFSKEGQGQGQGAKAVAELEQIAIDKGIKKVEIAAFTEAKGFWEKQGYSVVPGAKTLSSLLVKMDKPLEAKAPVKEAEKAPEKPTPKAVSDRFYIRQVEGNNKQFVRVEDARPVQIVKDVDTFIHKTDSQFIISEAKTGLKISSGATRVAAIDEAKQLLTDNKEELNTMIERVNSGTDLSPRYKVEPIEKSGESGKEPIAKTEAKKETPTENVDNNGKAPSKIAKSIERKAVDSGVTKGFDKLAGFDPITWKDQFIQASRIINGNVDEARAMIRGEEPLPSGLNGVFLAIKMEEFIKSNPGLNKNGELSYELANSPLISETSTAAQTLGAAGARDPDSFTLKMRELKTAREKKVVNLEKKRAVARAKVKEAAKEVTLTKDELDWDKFLDTIQC